MTFTENTSQYTHLCLWTILSSTLPEDVSVNVVKSCPKLNIVSNTPSRIVVCGRDLVFFSLFFLAMSNSRHHNLNGRALSHCFLLSWWAFFSCIALINMIVVEKLFPKQVFQNCWELLKAAQKGLVLGTLCNKNLTKQPENQMRLIEIQDKMDKIASFRVISHFFLVLLIFLIISFRLLRPAIKTEFKRADKALEGLNWSRRHSVPWMSVALAISVRLKWSHLLRRQVSRQFSSCVIND